MPASAPRSLTWLRAAALVWIGLLAGFAGGIEWIRTRPTVPEPSGGIDLVGAGATFPYPLYRRWFAEYFTHAGVRINYFSLGSGEGLRLLAESEVDFAAIDWPLSGAERGIFTCGPIEVPTAVGAIAVVVNLPRIASPVRFDAPTLAAIFLGRITRWDDPALRALNPTLALPDDPILVIQRARASGTKEAFADYLAAAPAWRAAQQRTETRWPVGEQVEGNEGVAGTVRATEGAIGFVELSYAQQHRLSVGELRNVAGRFVRPDSLSISRTTAELLAHARADTVHSLVGARDSGAYPVAAITRLIVDSALADPARGAHFIAFARWALRDGAAAARALGYEPLPPVELRRQVARLDALVPGACPAARAP